MVKIEDDDDGDDIKEETVAIAIILYGDILELILSKVALVELARAASLVSTEWRAAVSSSLRHLNPAKPWVFIHTQESRTPYTTRTRAYDTRSRSRSTPPEKWMQIHRPPGSIIKHVSTLRSSHSGMLYMLSPSTLSFSSDPFHLSWHHAESPFLWRTDPIVALVGSKLVVAGGGCDFEDDPLAVEIYDVNTRTWDSCEFMPSVLKDSAASTWLSVATDDGPRGLMFVVERQSGVMHTFHPESKKWTGPLRIIRPSPDEENERLSCSIITYNYSSGRLILIGIIGDNLGLKMWSVDPESPETTAEEIGEMPKEMFERAKTSGNFSKKKMSSSISACSAANWVYIYNNNNNNNPTTTYSSSDQMAMGGGGEIYVCEVMLNKDKGRGTTRCRWKREEIPVNPSSNPTPGERVVFTCSQVSIADVKEALSHSIIIV